MYLNADVNENIIGFCIVTCAPHANLVAWLGSMQARPSMKARTWGRLSEIAQGA